MSTFTEFHRKKSLVYSPEISKLLGEDYWYVVIAFTYYLGALGSSKYVRVPIGFITDGTTLPNWLTWLVPKQGKHSQAVVLHDWLCEHYHYISETVVNGVVICEQVRLTRKEIDQIFFEALVVLDVPKWRRFVIQLGVTGYRWVIRPTRPIVTRQKLEIELALTERLAA